MMALNLAAGAAQPEPSAARAAYLPSTGELALARRWTAAWFEGRADSAAPAGELTVLANHDPVRRNGRQGRPLNLAGARFTRGLYCHAVSKIQVRLTQPARTFTALVGVDSNEQTAGGQGSVEFAVTASGRELFRSPLLREGMAAVPVNVDLAGATEFILDIGDGGDGIACDQSDWAEAKVTLQDGTELWLGDLPFAGQSAPGHAAAPPFSFTYGGRASGELLKDWPVERASARVDETRTTHTVTWRDPATGLQVRCAGVEYRDFPTVEWTLHFKNGGTTDTPILADIMALDLTVQRAGELEYLLHHQVGAPAQPNDFEPFAEALAPSGHKRITTSGGRPTNSDWPYFNIEYDGGGLIAVMGWPGQWAAEFARDADTGLRLRSGQELTRFMLHPGEEVRGPLAVVQVYQGDWLRGQNLWRRWMLAHNVPRPGGELPPPHFAACSSHQFGEMIHANEENQKQFIDRYLAEGLKLDYWWMDAGWYVNDGNWPNTGTWEVDPGRFPNGLRAITDHGRSKGVRSIVWFEPERVDANSWLAREHPEWLIKPPHAGDQWLLLNLGNDAARQWLIDHVDGLITAQGIDLYRQDFNMDPLDYWRAHDAAESPAGDRQGMTEIRHVEGYLAYWDELRRRHPGMLIDTCASGGRRLDLETLRRAVPLLRSDYLFEPVSQQGHSYGLALWVPLFGTGIKPMEPYGWRSAMTSFLNTCYDVRRPDLPYETLRGLVGQWRAVADNFRGDYYPLTPYSLAADQWMAWQYDRPEAGCGMVQAFRHDGSPYESARLPLHGLDPAATYELRNPDGGEPHVCGGRELLERGVELRLGDRPMAAIVTYRRL